MQTTLYEPCEKPNYRLLVAGSSTTLAGPARLSFCAALLARQAFIKWGQWGATRPDLFPADLCATLARLHTSAPAHDFAHTRAAVEGAFRRPLEELFDEFDAAPVASGSIAQVHRAVLSARGASGSCYKSGAPDKPYKPRPSPLASGSNAQVHRAVLSARGASGSCYKPGAPDKP